MITFLGNCKSFLFDNNCAPTRCSSFVPCFFNPSEASKKLLFSASLVLGTFLVYKIAVFAHAYFSPPPPPSGNVQPPPARAALPPIGSVVSVRTLVQHVLPAPPPAAATLVSARTPIPQHERTPPSSARGAYVPLTARLSAFSPVERERGFLTARTDRSDGSAFTLVRAPSYPLLPAPPQTFGSRILTFFSIR